MRNVALAAMALALWVTESPIVAAQQASSGTYTNQTSSGTYTNQTSSGTYNSSDLRLKEDVIRLGRLDNGLNIYRFRYRGADKTVYVGVMAQEVERIDPGAVSRGSDGYLRVNYNRLGLRFMTWDEWVARGGREFPSSH